MALSTTKSMTPPMVEHPLQNQWVLWENWKSKADDYKTSMREICEFATIEEFWRNWIFIPKPSEIFCDGRREIQGKSVEAFSLFKKGIRPEWEDKENQDGCDLASSKPIFGEIDMFWDNLVFALLGETLEEENEICGARVLEKRKGGASYKSYFRLEIWMRNRSLDVITKLKEKLPEILNVEVGRNKLSSAEFDVNNRDNRDKRDRGTKN